LWHVPKTLLRWMNLTEFRSAYLEARGQALGQSNARLQQATSAAVTTLLKLMVSPEAPPATRVRAAQSVVELAQKSFELDNLELRLARLEESAGRDSDQQARRRKALTANAIARIWALRDEPQTTTGIAGTTIDLRSDDSVLRRRKLDADHWPRRLHSEPVRGCGPW
jgi:hypothetical protein